MQPTSPQATAPTAEPKQVTWADLDVDKDGSLSKAEVATVPALTQVFDAADADADGKLTAEEYKAHAAATSGAADDASEQKDSRDSPRVCAGRPPGRPFCYSISGWPVTGNPALRGPRP